MDKIERRANKKQNRKHKIHGKGLANWYHTLIRRKSSPK